MKPVIRDYIKEAIEIEKSGTKVEMKKVADYPIPREFQRVLAEDKALAKAFHSLTSGRQKGYLFYFSQGQTIQNTGSENRKILSAYFRRERNW